MSDSELSARVKKTFKILNDKLETENLTIEERRNIVYDVDHLIDYLPELEVIKKKEREEKANDDN